MAGTSIFSRLPSRMIEPLPNCLSICARAASIAFARSFRSSAMSPLLDQSRTVRPLAPARPPPRRIIAARRGRTRSVLEKTVASPPQRTGERRRPSPSGSTLSALARQACQARALDRMLARAVCWLPACSPRAAARRPLRPAARRTRAARPRWRWCCATGRPGLATTRSPRRSWSRSCTASRARGWPGLRPRAGLRGHRLRGRRRAAARVRGEGTAADRGLEDGRGALPRRGRGRLRRRERRGHRERPGAGRRSARGVAHLREALGRRGALDAARAARPNDRAAAGAAPRTRSRGGLAGRRSAGLRRGALRGGRAAAGRGHGRRALLRRPADAGPGRRPTGAARRRGRPSTAPSPSTPARPEALVERGGLRFLEKRYDDAVRDLSPSARASATTRTRATCWRPRSISPVGPRRPSPHGTASGEPVLGSLSLGGLAHTRDAVARRELLAAGGRGAGPGSAPREPAAAAGGRRLRPRDAASRPAGREPGRPRGRPDRAARALPEQGRVPDRHGACMRVQGQRAARLREPGGSGVELRRRLSLAGEPARGLPVPVLAPRLRPARVPRLLGRAGAAGLRRGRRRLRAPRSRPGAGSAPRAGGPHAGPAAPRGSGTGPSPSPGRTRRTASLSGLEARASSGRWSRAIAIGSRRRLSFFQAAKALGSVVSYPRGVVRLSSKAQLSRPDGSSLEPSMLAAQVLWGRGGSSMPIDDDVRAGWQPRHGAAPAGASADAGRRPGPDPARPVPGPGERGVAQALPGPIAPSGWLRRLLSTRPGSPTGRSPGVTTLVDVGVGLRICARRAHGILRIDYGHGLRDGRNAVFAGSRRGLLVY